HLDNQGRKMTSTHRTTIATRISRCLAATALISGLTIGVAATAGADREWDLDVFDKCIANENNGYTYVECCFLSGGEWNDEIDDCVAPAPLQNPQGQPSNPLIPVPRGPNSGTVG
ncbi:MAG TPA: hypothetical protein VGA66_19150, partial [Mycobacterium sp.]